LYCFFFKFLKFTNQNREKEKNTNKFCLILKRNLYIIKRAFDRVNDKKSKQWLVEFFFFANSWL